MKTIFSALLLMLATFTGFAQHDQHEASAMKDWPALSAFHDAISATYHPAEEGNLNPFKMRSGELVKKAESLSQSKIPSAFNNPKVVNAVRKLEAETKVANTAVKHQMADKKLLAQLGKVHDAFHVIVDLCNKH